MLKKTGELIKVAIIFVVLSVGLLGNDFSEEVNWLGKIDKSRIDLGLKTFENAETTKLYLAIPTAELGAYSHHSHITYYNNLLVASWSNHWTDEDSPGQYVRYAFSRDLGKTWSDSKSPNAVLFPPMEKPLQNTDRKYDKSNDHYTMCANGYAVVDGILYAVAEPSRGINDPGIGRIARSIGTDGKLGPIFWLNEKHEVPPLNKDKYDGSKDKEYREIAKKIVEYLKEPLHMPQWEFYGVAQLDGKKLSDWEAEFGASDRLKSVGEPTYAYINREGKYVRFWRTHAGVNYVQYSSDKGKSWSKIENSNFPDGGSRANVGMLPNGAAYVINNVVSNDNLDPVSKLPMKRDPLVISVANDGKNFNQIAVINRYAGGNKYEGRAKVNGYQYPHSVIAGDYMFVLYSANKEDIYVTKIPLKEIYNLPYYGTPTPITNEPDKPAVTTSGIITSLSIEAEKVEVKGFEIGSNSKASGGKYIYSKKDNKEKASESYKAIFKFQIEKEGNYRIIAHTASLGRTDDADSFYIKVNSGSIKPFYFDRTQDWRASEVKEIFTFGKGEQTVMFYSRESYSCLDRVEIVPVDITASTPTPISTEIEAEKAQISGFSIADNNNASEKKYIYSRVDSKDKANENYKAVFKFNIQKLGKYKIGAVTSSLGKTKDANSFYIKVNNGTITPFYFERTSDWKSNLLDEEFTLEKGENIITVYARESYSCLDKVKLVPINEEIVDNGGSTTSSTITPVINSEWFKSKSDSKITKIENGVLWSPVKKPTTIHTYFQPAVFEIGKTVTIEMLWESDGYDGSNKEIADAHKSNISKQGTGISDDYLRMLGGTGDFRIGFFQSDKKVGNDTFEGNVSGATKDFNNYKGFQVRIEPHLGEGYKSINRLTERKDNGDGESHINMSLWTRIKQGKYGLMSDQMQNDEDDDGGRSYTKDDKWGNDAIGWGPNAPFGKPTPLVVKITRKDKTNFDVVVTMNGNATPIMTGNFNESFMPTYFDTMAITYTNSSRRYGYVKISDMKIEVR